MRPTLPPPHQAAAGAAPPAPALLRRAGGRRPPGGGGGRLGAAGGAPGAPVHARPLPGGAGRRRRTLELVTLGGDVAPLAAALARRPALRSLALWRPAFDDAEAEAPLVGLRGLAAAPGLRALAISAGFQIDDDAEGPPLAPFDRAAADAAVAAARADAGFASDEEDDWECGGDGFEWPDKPLERAWAAGRAARTAACAARLVAALPAAHVRFPLQAGTLDPCLGCNMDMLKPGGYLSRRGAADLRAALADAGAPVDFELF